MVGASCSQWIACSPMRNGGGGRPLNSVVRVQMEARVEPRSHLERVAELERTLKGVTLFEHHYYLLVFGSFELEFGKPHRRLRIVWDGRERFLTVQRSNFPNQSSHPEWKNEQLIRVPAEMDVFETIENVVRAEFAL